MPANDLLRRLRAETTEVHARVERTTDVLARCRDRHSYALLLHGMREAYGPLESRIAASPDAPPDWSARTKTDWLNSDLLALGFPPWDSVGQHRIMNRDEVLGAMYVMEGATLGGAIVTKEIQRMAAPLPHRFFFAYGSDRARMWRQFCDTLANHSRTADHAAVVESATQAFGLVERACVSVGT